jgi:hypothetical protein
VNLMAKRCKGQTGRRAAVVITHYPPRCAMTRGWKGLAWDECGATCCGCNCSTAYANMPARRQKVEIVLPTFVCVVEGERGRPRLFPIIFRNFSNRDLAAWL